MLAGIAVITRAREGDYTPCDGFNFWSSHDCPSADPRCLGCHRRPAAPSPELEIAIGGRVQLARAVVRDLARALGIRHESNTLTFGQVDRLLEKAIELEQAGGGRGAEVATRAFEVAGSREWPNTIWQHVWANPAECLCVVRRADFYLPAVYMAAMLSYYELPRLRDEAAEYERLSLRRGERRMSASRRLIMDAEDELARIRKTKQYKAGMRRLAIEFAACPWSFLRVALER